MTSEEWFKSPKAIKNSQKKYAHFDLHTDIKQKREYISSVNNVIHHGFYPFIHYVKKSKKYSATKGKTIKERNIYYASHIDRCIYQYYGFLLNSLYNERLERDDLSNVSVAYRTNLRKNNIHFSKWAFDYIKENEPAYIIIGDFTDFFDNLEHDYLKMQWCSLLGTERLPSDHFAVFKNITSYSWVELSDLLKLNNLPNTRKGQRSLNERERVLTKNEFQANKVLVQKNKNSYGIPQGSPISGVLANIYMLEADKKINDFVQSRGGRYIRYSDDFIIILPSRPGIDSIQSVKKIKCYINQVPHLKLETNKTQYFYYEAGDLVNRKKDLDNDGDDSKRVIDFLGFTFNGAEIRIRPKTISKYYYRMYRKARGIVKFNGISPQGKPISGKNLYKLYSEKGACGNHGNFLTYVNRAASEYGPNEPIKRDTRRHMQKIRKVLKSTK